MALSARTILAIYNLQQEVQPRSGTEECSEYCRIDESSLAG